MRKDILFTTWHSNEKLYQMMSSFIDANVIPIDTSPAIQYFLTVLAFDWGNIKWLIHIDEDAFIFDLEKMYDLIDYMETNEYDVAGIPDGGVIKIRGGNPLSINPFFSIFNYKKVRDIILRSSKFEKKCDDLMSYIPKHLFKNDMPYDCKKISESYYPLFFNLLRNKCKFLWLSGIRSENDWTSTYLFNQQNEPFLIHTWFARRYINGKEKGFYPKHNYKSADVEYNSYRINDVFDHHKTLKLAKGEFKNNRIEKESK